MTGSAIKQLVKQLAKEINELTKEIKFNTTPPQFSKLILPSNGLYYKNRKNSLFIKYITSVEENILTDEMLMKNFDGLKMLLENIVVDNVNVEDLLWNDVKVILMFLRSTTFGDSIETEIVCPRCEKTNKSSFRLSTIKANPPQIEPNKNGDVVAEIHGIEFVLKPITFGDKIKIEQNKGESSVIKMDIGGEVVTIKKTRTMNLLYHIKSINNETNKDKIQKIINNLPRKTVEELKNVINKIEPSISENISFVCEYCGEEFSKRIGIDSDLIKLTPNYRENIMLEEIFLITYYGKGIKRDDAIKMPVYERKWHIRRIKKEMDAKAEKERAEYRKAQSKH